MNDEERMMKIIDALTQKKVKIPLQEVENAAKQEGLENPKAVIESLISQGVIMEEKGHLFRIVKRMFW